MEPRLHIESGNFSSWLAQKSDDDDDDGDDDDDDDDDADDADDDDDDDADDDADDDDDDDDDVTTSFFCLPGDVEKVTANGSNHSHPQDRPAAERPETARSSAGGPGTPREICFSPSSVTIA